MIKLIKDKQLKELLNKQEELDQLILKDIEIDQDERTTCLFVALMVELSEMMNELESFKYWKKNKNKTNHFEEAIDALHFVLSIINDLIPVLKTTEESLNIEIEKENYDKTKKLSYSELYLLISKIISDLVYENEEEAISAILITILIIIHKMGYTTEDMIKEYNRKYEINIQRQQEGY